MHKIYISPSNNTEIKTAEGDISESVICYNIARRVQTILRKQGHEIIVAAVKTQIKNRIMSAKKNDITTIISIKTNRYNGNILLRPHLYYANDEEKRLSSCICDELNKIIPNNASRIVNDNNLSLFLIEHDIIDTFFTDVHNSDMDGIIIDIGNIEDVYTSNFIIRNYDNIASAIASGIIRFLNGETIEIEEPVEDPKDCDEVVEKCKSSKKQSLVNIIKSFFKSK